MRISKKTGRALGGSSLETVFMSKQDRIGKSMNPDQHDIDRVIAGNLSGEASGKDENRLKDWILSSDEHYLTYKLMQESGEKTFHESRLLITDEAFEDVWSRSRENKPRTGIHKGYHALKVAMISAASVLLILATIFSYRQFIDSSSLTAGKAEPMIIEKFSPSGQKTKIFLPDGSSVWLNADSKLQYRSDYNQRSRTVWLTGEAYFDIKTDHETPFQVKSGNLAIRAYGTSFNVNTFYGNQEIEIVLEEGQLLVENLFTSLIPGMPLKTTLKPGEKALYSLKSAAFNVEELENTFDYTCWKNGILSFQHDDFNTVINKLEKWYGVNFTWSEAPVEDWDFSGEFNNEYLEQVLNAMTHSEGIEYRIENNSVQLIFPASDHE